MAKYLQDIFISHPEPKFHLSAEDEAQFYKENGHLWNAVGLIEDLFNFNFPPKYSTPDNLWRLHIRITTDPDLDLTKDGFENWFYLDLENFRELNDTNRKVFLFKKISHQIISYCKKLNYSFIEFEHASKIISDKNILFDEPHKKPKSSPDRKHKAFIWRRFSEFEDAAAYIKVIDAQGQPILFKKITNLHFRSFDKISWQDNTTILVSVHQYSDYDCYKISLDGSIEFTPLTKEGNCHYGIALLRNAETFDEGLGYVKVAEKMGHGKAMNIMLNLKNNPDERDIDKLMKQSRKNQNRFKI